MAPHLTEYFPPFFHSLGRLGPGSPPPPHTTSSYASGFCILFDNKTKTTSSIDLSCLSATQAIRWWWLWSRSLILEGCHGPADSCHRKVFAYILWEKLKWYNWYYLCMWFKLQYTNENSAKLLWILYLKISKYNTTQSNNDNEAS